MYTFEPYTSKQQIEEIIGFKSAAIEANNINECMVYLLFVHSDKVVASVLGYEENLGYRIDFSEKITFAENATFNAKSINGVMVLAHIK